MHGYNINGYVRIHKKRAETLYNEGEVIYLCPNNLRPGGMWRPEIAVAKTDESRVDDVQYFVSNTRDFDAVVNEYTFYNCGNWTRPAFYIKVD